MRRAALLSGIMITLIVLGFASSFVVQAQEGTPDGAADQAPTLPPPLSTPDPNATFTPTVNDPNLVGVPFGETFDTNWGWSPDGAWVYDPHTAFEGGGWHVDSLQRETISTLAYNFPLDLHGTLSVQLVYRQRGRMPASDLITLDLSLDGGDSWFSVDQQVGVETDWDRHIVDLTDFRGQVVRLRFRVITGIELPTETPDGTPTVITPTPTRSATVMPGTQTPAPIPKGYWIDNLSIQFVAPPPEMASLDFNGPLTHLGLHLVVGAQREPVLDLARDLRQIGHPLGTIKGTTGTEDIINAVKSISPETVTVYRSLESGDGMHDCPILENNPVQEAHRWMADLQPYWQNVSADYFEIMNECQYPAWWVVPFSIEAMRIAGSRGQCLLMFSFGVGNPEPEVFADLLPAFQYAVDNPCRPGQYHGVALHAYGINPMSLVSESGIYLGLRHRLFYAYVLPDLPEAIKLPVYITEAGPGDGRTAYSCADVTRDVLQYTSQLELDPYVRGFHLWNIGRIGPWIDFGECLPMIGEALVSYYGG